MFAAASFTKTKTWKQPVCVDGPTEKRDANKMEH